MSAIAHTLIPKQYPFGCFKAVPFQANGFAAHALCFAFCRFEKFAPHTKTTIKLVYP